MARTSVSRSTTSPGSIAGPASAIRREASKVGFHCEVDTEAARRTWLYVIPRSASMTDRGQLKRSITSPSFPAWACRQRDTSMSTFRSLTSCSSVACADVLGVGKVGSWFTRYLSFSLRAILGDLQVKIVTFSRSAGRSDAPSPMAVRASLFFRSTVTTNLASSLRHG